MVKALLLIFDPINTWDKIEKARRGALMVIFTFLLPLLLLTSAGEAYGLMKWGREQEFTRHVKPVPQALVLRYETTQLGFSLLILLGGAYLLKRVGEGFHRKHTYDECFRTVAYSLSPLFVFRLFNAVPAIGSWVCWGVGIVFAISALYRGIPRIMKPDPSNALGVYLTACLVFIFVTGLAHYLSTLVLDEKVLAEGWAAALQLQFAHPN